MNRNTRYYFLTSRFQLAIAVAILASSSVSFLVSARTYQFFRCSGSQGEIEFQQLPCEQGEGEDVLVEDRKSGWQGNSQRTLKRMLQKKASPSKRKQDQAAAQERQKEKCWRTRNQLDKVQWKLRRGYKGSEGNRLHQQRKEYRSYLQQFCRK